ncbi:M61 family metallopeptidase [Lutimonas zeaxanthinifaciens]|uniref:M61 family metallopeptidase n=1 Tax=Lutimonas zeaxanthinifaciens TaxID=3060215 RepID=UPI00265CB86C|nr:PDZ domain-containing protein [Lutimonas sp. YSD2104]WKK65638.1 PDZ domain-containing protein [Lutimonas sp. YSD2104]
MYLISRIFALCLFSTLLMDAQTSVLYEIKFENAVHHEADISIHFKNIESDTLSVRMSRSSPGRYAVHEFAKNVFDLRAIDGNGIELKVHRPNPYQWDITGHDGIVSINYRLFANHGDGTYSQVDETHAHLNIPATFLYAPAYASEKIELKINPRSDLNWKVATQLDRIGDNLYSAPNLQYFMDSPIEISDHQLRSFSIKSNGREYTIQFALHQTENYDGFEDYMKNVEKIVKSELKVFGELPDFDFGKYTFLACYTPNIDGDGMEHRNSTILTDLKALSQGGNKENIGTVAHEFFHAWNVERLRPSSLEPFDFTEANMSGELWFAEGFTSYYTGLVLCRSEIISRESYIQSLSSLLNRVWNSPGRNYYSPVEMSYQAPFVDAAASIDQVNRENLFISYYSYGYALGLALDLSLRNLDPEKSLDGYMKLVWDKFGRQEIPYFLKDLKNALSEYSTEEFSDDFFNSYIFASHMPDYKTLLDSVGVKLNQPFLHLPSFGGTVEVKDNKWLISSYPLENSSFYNAGLSKGDRIVSIDGKLTNNKLDPETILKSYNPGDKVKVVFNRYGKQKETYLVFLNNTNYTTSLIPEADRERQKNQNRWLSNN